MSNTFGIGFTIGAALSSTFGSAFSTVEQKIKQTSGQLDALKRKEKAAAHADSMQKRTMELQKQYSAGGGKDKILAAELQRSIGLYRSAQTEAAKYGLKVGEYATAHARASKELAKANSAMERYARQKAGAEKRTELRGRMMDTIGPVLAVGAPVKWAIDFESAMADAAKTIDGMRDSAGKLTPQYYAMEAAIKQMGRTLPLTHTELASLFAAGGQQGLSTLSELQEFTEMSAHMSVAFGMSTEEAADSIGGYRSAMHLTMAEARSMLDLMNQFANTTSASEKGIADIVRRIGPLGAVGGIAAKPMTALAATLDSMKIAPEVAATGIKNLILALTSGSAATKAQKEAFASLGISPVQLAKQMQKDGPAAIIKVLEQIRKLPKDQQLSIMQEIFGKESLGAITPLMDSLDEVKKNLVIAADETKYAGAMQQEFSNRSKTTANNLILMGNRVKEAGINIGSVLLPPINTLLGLIGPLVSGVADFAQQHQGLTTVVVGAAAGLIGFRLAAIGVAYAGTFMGGGLLNISKILGIFVPSLASATTASQVLAVGVRGIGMALRFAFGPVGLLISAAALGFGYLWEKCDWFREGFLTMWEGLKSVPGQLAEAFSGAMGELGESIGQFFSNIPGFSQVRDFFKDSFSGLKNFIGLGDEEKAKVEAKPVVNQAASSQAAASSTAASTPPAANAGAPGAIPASAQASSASALPALGGGGGTAVSMSFTLNGMSDSGFAKRVVAALESNRGAFERIISDIVHDQERLAYGG
ncbi:phage tail tape measure protein [Desulfovibrio desulfuricans]|uniref:phage tail tape measure protein n=1 Tax=Desulfovibrio desulfuricans TaxID=876 RepID=UPI001C011CC2|nr:phage tail tape measure protein [Desulfovibrio desulfuricans]MBT9749858.1 phage tail tape measure protein [Desulfovibrio desulfuricans]